MRDGERSPRPSGRERALTHLRDEVLADPAAQGTFVNEQAVATGLGISRTPVREALLLLAADGLVELMPQRGAWVPPVSGRQIRELMEMRRVLEGHAVTRVLTDGTAPVPAMRAALDEQRSLPADAPSRAFIEIDRRFHQALVDAVGNELFAATYAGLRVRQVRVGLTALDRGTRRRAEVCAEHEMIVAALEAGDERAAHRAVADHIDATSRLLLAF